MRSSWEASETNWRILASERSLTSKACSIWESMALIESASMATSEPSLPPGTRRERSPSAIVWVARSMPRKGRREERMSR